MKIGNVVYVVDQFLIEVRRCKIIGEEAFGVLSEKEIKSFWKTRDSVDGSLNYSCKETTFATVEEANEYIESLLDARFKILVEQTNTKEKLINYLYNLAKVNEVDNQALEHLEKEIKKHTKVDVTA